MRYSNSYACANRSTDRHTHFSPDGCAERSANSFTFCKSNNRTDSGADGCTDGRADRYAYR